MSTEYRRGIPSREHIEAATRLGLEWEENQSRGRGLRRWCWAVRNGALWCDFMSDNLDWGELAPLARGTIVDPIDAQRMEFRPFRTDGTPVDWEVLDAEVAKVAQPAQPEPRRFADVRPDRHGWRWWRCDGARLEFRTNAVREFNPLEARWGAWQEWPVNYWRETKSFIPTDEQGNPVSWDSIAAVPAQPQDFRADLWRRMCQNFYEDDAPPFPVSLAGTTKDAGAGGLFHLENGNTTYLTGDTRPGYTDAEILARWSVYQELRPLYAIVDGAQGEAPMPEDVEAAWAPGFSAVGYFLSMTARGLCASGPGEHEYYINDGTSPGQRLRNFAAVLDAVAEQRVAARQGQPQTVTATVAPGVSVQAGTLMMQTPEGARPGTWALQSAGRSVRAAQLEPAAPQPSYFAADGDTVSTPAAAPPWLHQMCAEMRATASWQRIDGLQITFSLPYGRKLTQGQLDRVRRSINPPGDIDATVTRFTVAATNRPAPPVPVCIVAAMRRNQDLAALSPDDSIPSERDATVAWSQFDDDTSLLCRNVVRDIVEHGCYGLDDAAAAKRASVYHELIAEAQALKVEIATHVRTWCSQFQTRTALLELDDVDHSQSTTLDSAPLKRGKTPTAEQIGKYREVMARRSGTVAEALKVSGIDSEVAQYVLDRWAGGLSDTEALWAIIVAEGVGTLAPSIDRATIDERVQRARKPALDTSEPADGTAQRQREEREAQRQRMAALQAQLAAERAALRAEPQPEPTRFDLLECDLEANPAASIAAWEARMAQRSVRPAPVVALPAPLPMRRALPFEVVDVEAEGLTRGGAIQVLLGRAMNGGC